MKKIKFSPINELTQEIIDYPKPASSFIPEWYRNLDQYVVKNNIPRSVPPYIGNNKTVKACIPFFDSMTSGYMATLPCDIYAVDPKEYGSRIIWDVSYPPIGEHSSVQIGGMGLPYGHSEIFKWMFPFIIKTPPGYSCTFSHPKHRYDLPFVTLDGVVDTDMHPSPVNFPFIIKDDFVGKIAMGTPICQITPFKRESWKSENEKYEKKNDFVLDRISSVMGKSYRNRFWSRKIYK
jgi:hypothetical protein